MDRESVERLRYDIRLKRRREWLTVEDRAAYVASLPDLSDKMIRGSSEDDEPDEAPGQAAASFAPPADPAPHPTPNAPTAPIPFGSSASPSGSFPNDGGGDDGGSGFS